MYKLSVEKGQCFFFDYRNLAVTYTTSCYTNTKSAQSLIKEDRIFKSSYNFGLLACEQCHKRGLYYN